MSTEGPFGRKNRIRQIARDTKPVDKQLEGNLRNLLILGFIRKHSSALPTKFFDILNEYYFAFDRWVLYDIHLLFCFECFHFGITFESATVYHLGLGFVESILDDEKE